RHVEAPSTPTVFAYPTLFRSSSLTVKVVLQVALLVAASVAVTVITCTPNPTSVPAAGDWLKVSPLVPLQLSLALTPPNTSGTAAIQFVPALTLVGAGQVTVGAVSSVTVKVVVQVALLDGECTRLNSSHHVTSST